MNNENLTPLHEIGKQFQEARLHRGVLIEDVAKNLKISSKILRAIEDGDRDALPQLVFLCGFIKSYGESLGFSKADLQKTLAYLEESEPKSDLTPRAPEKSTYMSDTPYVSKKAFRKKAIITALIALFVLIASYAAYTFLFTPIEVDTNTQVEIDTDIKENDEAKSLINSVLNSLSQVGAEDTIEEAKEIKIQKEEAELEALATKIAEDLAKENTNTEQESAISIPQPVQVNDNVPAFIDDDELERAKIEAEAPEYERVSTFGTGRRTLLITASQECWISFELDYRDPREVYLAPGQEVFVRFETEANVRVGNAGGVNVTYNGQNLGAPGREGQVRRLTYPFRQQ